MPYRMEEQLLDALINLAEKLEKESFNISELDIEDGIKTATRLVTLVILKDIHKLILKFK